MKTYQRFSRKSDRKIDVFCESGLREKMKKKKKINARSKKGEFEKKGQKETKDKQEKQCQER